MITAEENKNRYKDFYEFAPFGYLIINDSGLILEANLTATKMLAVPEDELQQQMLRRFIHEADQDPYYSFQRRLFKEPSSQRIHLRLYRQDGTTFYALLEGVPMSNHPTSPQARVAISDISELAWLQSRAERKSEELILTEDELEERVAARTAELNQTNLALEALIREQEAAETALQQRNQELELLHRFSLLITGKLDLTQILQPFATLLQEELTIPGGFVFFYDRRRHQIYPQLSWGLSATEAKAMMSWPLTENPLFQENLGGDVILHRHIEDVPFFCEHGVIAAHPQWQSFVGVPVIVGEKVYGAFGLFRQSPTTFRAGELNFFKALAQVMRTAVQNARLFESVSQNQEQLRRLAHRIFSTQEKERQRVSRELHDEAGQALTGLNIYLQMIGKSLKEMESELQSSLTISLEKQIETAVELCQTTSDHIRTLAQDLRPAALENLGLNTALQAFCRDFARRTQLDISYSGQDSLELPEAVAIGLYRFLQEALTNVARHAEAKAVKVQLQYDTKTTSLTVTDDGQGFNALNVLANMDQTGGIGLAGMKERIESVGGQLTITSEGGKGTTLIAWIPL
jgi:PAS domain S-box-containing protein